MCGIAGWIGSSFNVDQAKNMLAGLQHRGPDGNGEWLEDHVWLGHRRLAIIDLSPSGHQPMLSSTRRYVLSYNGEVYNYPEIRIALEKSGHVFLGHSDTEVMLAAFDQWGIDAAIQMFNGMFAFGVWDRKEHTLSLVRDRMGEKPLYYAENSGNIAFASELSALWRLPWLDKRVDKGALASYFRYLCVPAPATIIHGARKLQPGTIFRWKGGTGEVHRYWSVSHAVESGLKTPFRMDFRDAADELEKILQEAVRIRLRSDVPYGALLSGGIDSSLIVALMQQESRRPIFTFTIGFPEKSHDESVHARAIAAHLGTRHTEETLLPQNVIDLVPYVASLHDEPFADSSSIPTFLLAQFTRKHVKVALSGDGGDELFGGYPRYFWAERIEKIRHKLTPTGAGALAGILESISAGLLDNFGYHLLRRKFSGANGFGSRVHRFSTYLRYPPEDVYRSIVSAWKHPEEVILGGGNESNPFDPNLEKYKHLSWAASMMAVDQENYLPNDILTKMDRVSMSVALEARAPLLDHRLVEWAWRLPMEYKLSGKGDTGKLLLRTVLYRYVPREMMERPKMGFGMPIGKWLRNELREWAEEMLSFDRLTVAGLNARSVHHKWQEHLSGLDRLPEIWTVLMWIQWQEKWKGKL